MNTESEEVKQDKEVAEAIIRLAYAPMTLEVRRWVEVLINRIDTLEQRLETQGQNLDT